MDISIEAAIILMLTGVIIGLVIGISLGRPVINS
jgi:hypothetical protein